jgi:hypothetical protein
MKKLKTPIELKGRVIRYETIVHLKKVKKSMKGGESEALNEILEIAKQKFFNDLKNRNNKQKILEKMQSLPNHSTVSHTPIEPNWKNGAKVIQEIQDDKGKLIAKLYETTIPLKKSATNKTIREILDGLRYNSIEIIFTWSHEFKLVFVNFYSTISDESAIEYVNHVYEPCTPEGKPKEGAPPYSYYASKYDKPDGTPPYLIISREFTNQIYDEWLGRGTLQNFKDKLDALTDESELPLRFLYKRSPI